MIRIIAGSFLALHGVAHAAGFTASWAMVATPEAPYTTMILNGTVDIGDAGIRLVGMLWLVAAVAMMGAAVQVLRGSPGAATAVAAAAIFSLIMCVIGLPAAIAGVVIDVAILGAIWSQAIRAGAAGEAAG